MNQYSKSPEVENVKKVKEEVKVIILVRDYSMSGDTIADDILISCLRAVNNKLPTFAPCLLNGL